MIYILTLILFCLLGCRSIEFLQFMPQKNAAIGSIFMLTDDAPIVKIDATYNKQRTIYFAQRSRAMVQELTFYCLVNKQNVSLSKVAICCRKHTSDAHNRCSDIPKHTLKGKLSCSDVTFQYELRPTEGAVFSILIPKDSPTITPINGLFSCLVTKDEVTALQSNEIELRDAVYYTRQLSTTSSNKIDVIEPLKPSQFPYEFNCMEDKGIVQNWPTWMNNMDSRHGPYQWAYCSTASKVNALTCARSGHLLSPEISITFINGSIFVTDEEYFSRESIALVCRTTAEHVSIRTYASKITDEVVPTIMEPISVSRNEKSDILKLQPLTATYSNYTIQKGENIDGFDLKALYKEPTGTYNYIWTRNGERFPGKVGTKYSYQFSGTADESVSGKYVLTISKNDDTDQLKFQYNVTVVSPPTLNDVTCPSGLYYIMEGGKFDVSCEYDGRWNSKMYVGVGSVESTDDDKLRSAIETNYKYSNQELSKLEIHYKVQDLNPRSDKLSLSLTKLQLKQDFKLSLRVQSDYGQAHVSSFLRVVPKPKLIISPSNQNCDQECDLKPYNVSCVIDPDLITEWQSNFEVDVAVGWIVQNQWSTKDISNTGLSTFLTLSGPLNSMLTIWPQGKPDTVADEPPQMDEPVEESNKDQELVEKQVDAQEEPTPEVASRTLKQYIAQKLGGADAHPPSELVLRCWISLIVNQEQAQFNPIMDPTVLKRISRQLQSNGNALVDRSRIIYDSRWETDSFILNYLTMKRSFTQDTPAATASLAWLSAVIIGVLVLLVVIILSMWLCSRDRGETYMVYDKERAYGNDPIQELKEKETFQTFQRQEEPPIASSRYSLNDGSMRVESEDDGELDEYAGGNVTQALITTEHQQAHNSTGVDL